MTFSAGLAIEGMIPFCNIYSSFMQRSFDQVIHDVAIQNLPVVICVDRAGLVGEDGATHHGVFDLPFLRCIPNLTIASPLNEVEFRNMLFSAQHHGGPYVIRYPRGTGVLKNWKQEFSQIKTGKSQLLRNGDDLLIISIGPIGNNAAAAIDELEKQDYSVAHLDLRFLKPLDEKLLGNLLSIHKNVLTIEDGSIHGGMGSAILEFISENGFHTKVKRLGVPDRFIDHGTVEELYRECGMDQESIISTAKAMMKSKVVFKAM